MEGGEFRRLRYTMTRITGLERWAPISRPPIPLEPHLAVNRCHSYPPQGTAADTSTWGRQETRGWRLTASRLAEPPCGEAARPGKVSLAPKPNTRMGGSVEDPRPFQGASPSTPFGAPEAMQSATPFGAPEGVRARSEAERAPSSCWAAIPRTSPQEP